MRGKTAVLGLAAVLVLGGCGDDNDSSAPTTTVPPATTTTLSQAQLDKQKAQRIVLTTADLPGYTVDPPDPSGDTPEVDAAVNACANNNPIFVQLDLDNDPRGAASPDFSKGEAVTVGSGVTFADTEDQARSLMADLNAASFPACFSRAILADLREAPGVTNARVNTTKLPAIAAGEQSFGYRAVARFRFVDENVTLNLDWTLIRVGRAVAGLDALWTTTPFPEAERLRLAQAIAGRMAAP